MITMLGRDDSREEFIREHLNPRVTPTFLYMEGAPTITKRRYIESYPFQKMFEVYFMREDEAVDENAAHMAAILEDRLASYDLVIVTDYGHGMIGSAVVDVLCRKSRCLAVNTQTNADNHGFNTVSKYPRADYFCVSEKELRLEARNRRGDIRHLMGMTAERTSAGMVMVTQGKQGLLCYEPGIGYSQVPAFADHFVDRVGAGDAVFAVTSLCRAAGAGGEEVAFIGNCVGAMAVAIVGNRRAIPQGELKTLLKTLLK
jgi:bifunctional ADP-heptose synthase (sugar kinase/adenylyltransferase)